MAANAYGTVFKMTPAGVLTNIHIFQGPATHDGRWPFSPLIQGTNGLFYGTTSAGGTPGYGTVFQMDMSGNLTVIYSFTNGPDGSSPYAGSFRAVTAISTERLRAAGATMREPSTE